MGRGSEERERDERTGCAGGKSERERDERTALLNGCAGGKSERERRCRESPKKTKVSRSIGAACSLSRGHQLW